MAAENGFEDITEHRCDANTPTEIDGKRRRGRAPTFTVPERRLLAHIVRINGARATRELTGRQISLGTLLKIAKEFDIQLKTGRRPSRAA